MYPIYNSSTGLGEERLIGFFTMSNGIAGSVIAFVVFIFTGIIGMPLNLDSALGILRTVMLLASFGTGVFISVRWQGLSLLDRLMYAGNHRIRVMLSGGEVEPDIAIGAELFQNQGIALYQGPEMIAVPLDMRAMQEEAIPQKDRMHHHPEIVPLDMRAMQEEAMP